MARNNPEETRARTPAEPVDGSGFEGIGLSLKAGWYVSAVMYGFGGVLIILLHLLTDSIPPLIVVFAVVAIAASPIWLILARIVPTAAWGPHVRIAFGIVLIGTVIFSSGGAVSSMVPVMMLPVLTSAYMHRARVATPYCLLAIAASTTAVVIAPSPATTACAVVTFVTMATLSIAAIVSQYQLRTVAELNNELSETDALTGIANVRRMRGRLQELIDARYLNHQVAVFTLDLDDFKKVNDEFSHSIGDDLLKAVAEDLQNELDPSDLPVRRGGDEFAVIALIPDHRDLENLRVRLEAAIHQARMRVCPSVNPHGSVGYVIHCDGETVDQLLARGDDALHEAKLKAHPERKADVTQPATVIPLHRNAERSIGEFDETDSMQSTVAAAEDLKVARWIQRLLGTGMAWRFAAVMNVVIAGTFELLSATQMAPDLSGTVAQIAIAGLFALAALCLLASSRQWPAKLLAMSVAANIGLTSTVILQTSGSRADVVDLCLLPVMFSFYYFSKRQAFMFLFVGMGLQTGLMFSSHYPNATARATATIFVVVIISALLSKARGMTREFTEQAVEMSVVDPLTGVANVRGLRRRLVDEIDRCRQLGGTIGMLTIDLDDFKSVNDVYSHTVGDSVLVATANAIKQVVRSDDMIARRGGDEFAVICLDREYDDLRSLEQRVARAIESARLALCPDLLPTASVGRLRWGDAEDCDKFLARGDRELHDAKQASHRERAAMRSVTG